MFKGKFAEHMLVRYADETTLQKSAAWVLVQPRFSQIWAYRSLETEKPYFLFITWKHVKDQLPRVRTRKLRCKFGDIETGVATRIFREDNSHEWQKLIVVCQSHAPFIGTRITSNAALASGITSAQPRVPVGQVLDPTLSEHQSGNALKWQALLWAAFTEPRELFVASDLRAAVINFTRSSYHNPLGSLSWLYTQEVGRLQALLGEGFICSSHHGYDVHQSVVTVKHMDRITSDQVSVQLQAWNTLADELQRLRSFQYDSFTRPDWLSSHFKNTILFIQPTAIEAVDRRQLANMYKTIRLLQPGSGALLRAYPNEIEVEKEHTKLGDIKSLDHIAYRALEWKYQYRPQTCYQPGTCKLIGFEQSVHKRTDSDCAKHVEVRHHSMRDGLICQLPHTEEHGGKISGLALHNHELPRRQLPSKVMDSGERWFHQEYVANLAHSEYRVFIVTEPCENGLRGRSGHILKIILTSSASLRDTSNKNILAQKQTPQNCHEYEELQEFALHVFDELRGLPGAALEFESLDVGGVRLDIAKSNPDPSTRRSRFFVNEITRWHSAYYFSRWACLSPFTEICEAYANAFCSYFFPEEKDTDPGNVGTNT